MATASKRKTPSKGRKPPGAPLKPPAPRARPALRFYQSGELRKKTLSLLGTIEKSPDATVHREALANLVVELTNSGMDFYFMKPLRLARAGFILEQSADLGMRGVLQAMATVIRQIIGRMQGPQLLSVCSSIRKFMR